MRCEALVKARDYGSLTGRCYQERGVQVVRWAPTPLKTQVMRLCTAHRTLLERRGSIEVVR